VVAQVSQVGGPGLDDQSVSVDGDAERDDVLDVAESDLLGVADRPRRRIDQSPSVMPGGGDDGEHPAGPQHPPGPGQEQAELLVGEHPQLGPARRAAAQGFLPGRRTAGLMRWWRGDDQGDIAKVIGESPSDLVGPRGPHLHACELLLIQGGS
jgi:hypothetical protein